MSRGEQKYLCVLKVDRRMSEYELFRIFDEHGRVETVVTPIDRSRRFAYVKYNKAEDAHASKIMLNATEFYGQLLSVELSYGPESEDILYSNSDKARQRTDEKFPNSKRKRPKITNSYSRIDYDKDRERQRAAEELEKKSQRASEELEKKSQKAAEEHEKKSQRAAEELEKKSQRAGEGLEKKSQKAAEEHEKKRQRSDEELERKEDKKKRKRSKKEGGHDVGLSSSRYDDNSRGEQTYLCVLKVDPSMSEYELFRIFDEHGRVERLLTPIDRSRRFAYVKYNKAEDALASKIKLNAREFYGQLLSVELSYGPESEDILYSNSDKARQRMDKKFPNSKRTRPKITNSYYRSDYEKDRERERKRAEASERERKRAEVSERERQRADEELERKEDKKKHKSSKKEGGRDVGLSSSRYDDYSSQKVYKGKDRPDSSSTSHKGKDSSRYKGDRSEDR